MLKRHLFAGSPSLALLFIFIVQTLPGSCAPTQPTSVDLVVYGGTASGVMTAYSAAKEGLHVVLLEPRTHLGGMVTGGLSATDLGQFQIIGGYARDFYMRAAAHYGVTSLTKHGDWLSEPHVGEEIFRAMLREAGVSVQFHEKLLEQGGVSMTAKHVTSIKTEDGKVWKARIFADCSYEGDLMAQSKVKYTIGREAIADYGEDLAGVRAKTPAHQFTWPLNAYDSQHKLLPEISAGPLDTPGSGDKKVQAYNFRLILTHDKANQVPYPKPSGYDPARFALLRRYLTEFEKNKGRAPNFHDVTNPVLIPNQKADFNNNGPVSTDYIGHSWGYPDGSYAQKQKIWADTVNYTQSFFYFLAHDASVPPTLQREVNEWGLSKDEFVDNGNFPNQLYIREGRRMVGSYVMRQADLQTTRTKSDSIGMGSYQSDSHNIQRVAREDGTATNEGDVQVAVQPYEIPVRVLLPEKDQVDNLLVPVCLSASHVAYSSVRMEPQYMIIGQAAGVVASMAIQHATPVQDISVSELQQKLRRQKAVLNLDDAEANPKTPQGARY
ncbi:FAD-dependent oxidoreductase [soil metagenome]